VVDRPLLLDLFCGVGGAGAGYSLAGFEIVGVDIAPQPRYPFRFIQADAMTFPLAGFDAVHASPPCQAYTWSTRIGREDRWPQLIADVRERVQLAGLPYVIENVPGARADMRDPVLLCGSMFGLEVNRHRLFESSAPLWPAPPHRSCAGRIADGEAVTVAGHGGDSKDFRIARWQQAMQISWTKNRHELAEAIPPAYTAWIGAELLAAMNGAPARRPSLWMTL
jgi:DNA (cytosine-5)-methyltransferase 1